MEDKNWPFIISRQMLGLTQHPDFPAVEAKILKKYPGVWNEGMA